MLRNVQLTQSNNWNSSDILHDGTENNWTNRIYYTKTYHDIANLMDSQSARYISLELVKVWINFISIYWLNGFHTCVKSAPMNACSIPIQTVIKISNCWLGFLHWFSVAESRATPDSSFADSDPFRFSPYLKGGWIFRLIQSWKQKRNTLIMDPKTEQ